MPLCRALVGLWCILMALPRTLSLSSRDSLGRETAKASKEYFDSFYVERVTELMPKSMSKRSVNSNQNSWFNENEKLIINGLGKKFVLILSRSKEFIAPGFVVQRMTDNTTFIEEFKDGGIYSKCFYSGTVQDNNHSVASLSLCGALKCIVCDAGNGDRRMKQFKSLETIKKAAKRRLVLKKDMFKTATIRVNELENIGDIQVFYHTECNKRFCAVKKPAEKCSEEPQTLKKTRSSLTLPGSNSKGVLNPHCIFCTQQRKRSKTGIFEELCRVETMKCRDDIISAARKCPHVKKSHLVMSLGSEDLIAIEAKYHDSCKKQYLRETRASTLDPIEQISSKKVHQLASQNFLRFIESEIITKNSPKRAGTLMSLYIEEYVSAGGIREDLSSYTQQALMAKIKCQFGNRINFSKDSNREGNFVYSQVMTRDDAKASIQNSSIHFENARSAAMALRSEILNLPKTTNPFPTSIHTLKNASSCVPTMTNMFFNTLVNGLSTNNSANSIRRSQSLAADAVFSTTRGCVRPWKNTPIGLGLSSMTGSKTVITLLNRHGHTISYDECKRIETEMAYSCSIDDYETPAGLSRNPMLSTGTAWDNFDLNIETLDGKNSLHVTVGIAYQNILDSATENSLQDDETCSSDTIVHRRRRYDGPLKIIPPFHKNLKQAKFNFGPYTHNNGEKDQYQIIQAKGIDFLWLLKSQSHELPMFNGFYSKFVTDPLPLTVIGYMDPISHSPTRNDVVQETMVRSLAVADENGMSYVPVTYDLAVALKAYSIQALRKPDLDRLVILLGNFHLELAFFGAIGTFIADSGLEYILTEAGILAEGSLAGLLKGKHYNRCSRIHQIAATVMEKMLLNRYLTELCTEDNQNQILADIKETSSDDTEALRQLTNKDSILGNIHLLDKQTPQRKNIKTNDVESYIQLLPQLNEVFFALNRPNYARWGSLFLRKFETLDKQALDILKAGAFSIRRTTKPFSRTAIDLTLEQTINCDAASSTTGITHFGNSENFRVARHPQIN